MFQITVRSYSLNFKPSLILPKNKTHLIHNCSMCVKTKGRAAVYLFLKLVEDKFDDDIILKAKDLRHTLGYPRLHDFQVDLGHIHLKTNQKTILKHPWTQDFPFIYSEGKKLLDPLLIFYICPVTKKPSVYNFNGRFILTVRDRIKINYKKLFQLICILMSEISIWSLSISKISGSQVSFKQVRIWD